MKKLVIFALVISLVLLGYLSYEKFKEHQFISEATPIVKNISIRTTKAVGYQIGAESITYKELYDRLEDHISEIDNKVIEMQSLVDKKNERVSGSIINYLQSSQSLIRKILQFSKIELEYISATKAMLRINQEYSDINASIRTYGASYVSSSLDRVLKNFNEAKAERNKLSNELHSVGIKHISALNDIKNLVPDDALISKELLDKMVELTKPTEEPKSEDGEKKKTPAN